MAMSFVVVVVVVSVVFVYVFVFLFFFGGVRWSSDRHYFVAAVVVVVVVLIKASGMLDACDKTMIAFQSTATDCFLILYAQSNRRTTTDHESRDTATERH